MSRQSQKSRARGIVVSYVYSAAELLAILGITERTLRNWRNEGLPYHDASRGTLLYDGAEVAAFLTRRKNARKVRSEPWELYCFGCKGTHSYVGREIAVVSRASDKMHRLGWACLGCGTRDHRAVTDARMREMQAVGVVITGESSDCLPAVAPVDFPI